VGYSTPNHDADASCQEIYLRDLNLEFANLKLAESVKSAQAATDTLHKDWQEIKSAEIAPPKGLTSFLSSTRTQNQTLRSQVAQKEEKERGALAEYCDQGEPRSSDYQINLMKMK
jgi:hypothetical protein